MAVTVSTEFMNGTYSVPTIIVNRFVISHANGGARLVVGEAPPLSDDINHRVALQMSYAEAAELLDLLRDFINPAPAPVPSSPTPPSFPFGLGGVDAKRDR